MFGDRLYDLALACVFFDMYGRERDALRNALIEAALTRVGAAGEGTQAPARCRTTTTRRGIAVLDQGGT